MPLSIDALFSNHYSGTWLKETWLKVSGATAGNVLVSYVKNSANARGVTSGYATAASAGTVLIPVVGLNSGSYLNSTTNANAGFVVRDTTSGETVTVSGPWYSVNNRDRGTWTVSQNSAGNITVSCTSLGATSACPIFTPIEGGSQTIALDITTPPQIWEISLLDNSSVALDSKSVRPPLDGGLPSASFSSVPCTGTYFVKIKAYPYVVSDSENEVTTLIASTLTAPAVTSGGGGNTNMFSWLNNDYWYLNDLQVNLGTRAVTHRHGTVEIKPNDTINFAVLFHNGSAGVDPVATDLRLAVRSSANTSAYHFWSAATVTTASVSGDTYYTLTVTASDEDLLAAQAAGLLAGSNAAQSLLAEVQWTTTRGTFSSDTFTISVPNEVVREPDV